MAQFVCSIDDNDILEVNAAFASVYANQYTQFLVTNGLEAGPAAEQMFAVTQISNHITEVVTGARVRSAVEAAAAQVRNQAVPAVVITSDPPAAPATPNVAPATPDATPAATPPATPDATPSATPDATPSATPDATPSATPSA